jgi:hypothetical protein
MVIGKSKDQGSENAGIEDIISTDFIVARHDLQQFKTVRAQQDDLSSPDMGAQSASRTRLSRHILLKNLMF